MYNLNYNQLYYFYVVATLGSIKKACNHLHLTQPSISGGIKNLEDSLGFKLFDREYRQLKLNKNGKKIYGKAQKIFSIGQELLAEINSDYAKANDNTIKIGICYSIPSILAVDLIDLLWEKNKIQLNVEYGTSTELNEKIKEGEIDLFFSNEKSQDDFRFKSDKILTTNYSIVANKNFEHLKVNFPSSIEKIPCIALGNDNLFSGIQTSLNQNNMKLNIIGKVGDTNSLIQTAQRGHCISITDNISAQQAFKNNQLISIGDIPNLELSIWSITNHFSSNKKIISNLVSEISQNYLSKSNFNRNK